MKIQILDIDHELMAKVKMSLNHSLTQALRNLEPNNVATIALKMEIEMADGDDQMTQLMPIDFSCNVTTKKDVSKDKGVITSMVVTGTDNGFLASSDDGQISIFEVMSEDSKDDA